MPHKYVTTRDGQVIKEWTTYSYDELNETAKGNALGAVQNMLAESWDSFDVDRISEAIVYALAKALGSPGWDTYGSGDFTGIKGLKVAEWDVSYRSFLAFDGYLTPETAPKLPWPDDSDLFRVGPTNEVWTTSGFDLWLNNRDDVKAFKYAWDSALEAALKAGREEYEYMSSEEAAQEYIDANEPEFTETGELA
jgi:hypothetical protein